ncbi:phosphate ABC transporter substrate-binding protein [Oceaniferula marina]|nr:phosphate ABC transporter substrate-binding protein [Oceaniferula marina]
MKMIQSTAAAIAALAMTASVQADSKIVIKGSDTLGAKLVPQLKEAYVQAGNKVDIEIQAQGSSHAFSNLLAGSADIGMSSRKVKDSETDKFNAAGKKLVEHVAAWDMIAVIVNDKNPVRKLTLKQIEGIFTGDITDWSQVGGKSGKISVYTRNTSSGTYKSFQKLGMSKRDYATHCQKMEGNQQIATEVSKNPLGIGYVGLAYSKGESYRAVKVDNVAASPSKVAKYPLARKLFYYTIGEPAGESAKFLDWATSSDKAAEVVGTVGFIPTSAAK